MKPLYVLLAFLITGFHFLFFIPAQGQTSITKTDVEHALAIGTTSTGYITPSGVHPVVHIGPASGVAQTWDFRSYTFQISYEGEFIESSVAPQISSFPQANVIRMQKDDVNQITMFQYNQITDAEYLLHGIGNDSDTTLVRYNPPVPQMRFPMTFGTNWTYTGLPSTPYPGITMQTSYKWTVDAFGTVQLPEGDFPALRLRVETFTSAQTPGLSYLRKALSYNFISKTLNWVYISVDTNDIGKEDVNTFGVGYEIATNATAVEGSHSYDRSFALQNYPNPFAQQTTLSFQLTTPGYITLKVYDAFGRIVKTLVEGKENPGPHSIVFDASHLPPGVYFYKLAVGNKTVSAKAIVRK